MKCGTLRFKRVPNCSCWIFAWNSAMRTVIPTQIVNPEESIVDVQSGELARNLPSISFIEKLVLFSQLGFSCTDLQICAHVGRQQFCGSKHRHGSVQRSMYKFVVRVLLLPKTSKGVPQKFVGKNKMKRIKVQHIMKIGFACSSRALIVWRVLL